MADEPSRTRPASGPVTGLFVLACLYLARLVLLPLTLGRVVDFLFRPAVRAMKRARITEPAGAALVILVLCSGFALIPVSERNPGGRDCRSRAPSAII